MKKLLFVLTTLLVAQGCTIHVYEDVRPRPYRSLYWETGFRMDYRPYRSFYNYYRYPQRITVVTPRPRIEYKAPPQRRAVPRRETQVRPPRAERPRPQNNRPPIRREIR